MGTKKVQVELSFHGSGRVENRGGSFHGGVVAPALKGLRFQMHRQVLDENRVLNPVIGEDSVDGSFQINIIVRKDDQVADCEAQRFH
jgi:hypothetical protein